MKISSRLLFVIAALLLVPTFYLPLWSIGLWAPQYSDGLGMFIGLTDIWGHNRHDIQNINILNHYIGMQAIDPERVTALTIMPWVVGGLIAAALVTAAVGRRTVGALWIVAFVLLGAAGMYEFYSWNYDYGTNLSPDAPIKVPGMTYVPPLLGTSQILNIRASSYPSWGTLFITLSLLAGSLATWREYRRGRSAARATAEGAPARAQQGSEAGLEGAVVLLLVVAALSGCGTDLAKVSDDSDRAGGSSAEIARAGTISAAPSNTARAGSGNAGMAGGSARAGSGNAGMAGGSVLAGLPCDYCEGVVPKERFGGEIVTRSGETYRFMSVECMAGFVLEARVAERDIRSMRVVDFNHGARLVDARTAQYLNSPNRPSPNGLYLLAVDDPKIARNLVFFFHGELLEWDAVLALVAEAWALPGRPEAS